MDLGFNSRHKPYDVTSFLSGLLGGFANEYVSGRKAAQRQKLLNENEAAKRQAALAGIKQRAAGNAAKLDWERQKFGAELGEKAKDRLSREKVADIGAKGRESVAKIRNAGTGRTAAGAANRKRGDIVKEYAEKLMRKIQEEDILGENKEQYYEISRDATRLMGLANKLYENEPLTPKEEAYLKKMFKLDSIGMDNAPPDMTRKSAGEEAPVNPIWGRVLPPLQQQQQAQQPQTTGKKKIIPGW